MFTSRHTQVRAIRRNLLYDSGSGCLKNRVFFSEEDDDDEEDSGTCRGPCTPVKQIYHLFRPHRHERR